MKTSSSQFRLLLARAHSRQEERNIRLAREIHDDVSQQLTALSIELSLLQRRLAGGPEAEKVGELLQLVSGISSSVKKTMNELRPKVLDEFGLVAALRYECQRYEKIQQRKVSFSSEMDDVKLPAEYASEIFRLFQELFSHVGGDNSETEMSVKLTQKGRHIQIDVQKAEGKAPSKKDDKYQFLHISEHAKRLGGTAQRRAGNGRLRLPLNNSFKN